MRIVFSTLVLSVMYTVQSFSSEFPIYVVSKDGSGAYTTIQAALDAVPSDNRNYVVIFIKKGVYNEHVAITKSFVALIGEDRESTRIEYNLPRKAWYAVHGTNTGCGVINIASNDSCIIIGNLTVVNTYDSTAEDYTEVIRSETGSTKIWVVHCNVWCKYKDTFALWGKANGRYYAANCSFRGSIDAVCPRGWCYILHSEFIETRYSSPIWHEGVEGLNQKLVIRYGHVTSILGNGIKLQNAQGSYAQFYYLDCTFSDSIKSQGASSPTYYWNCHRRGVTGDASWFADNLPTAPGSPKHTDITAAWTFENSWDPENEMPAVLPFASLPQPFHRAYDVSPELQTLRWCGALRARSYNIYFGTTPTPEFLANQSTTEVRLESLSPGKTYYWRVDAITDEGIVQGDVWSFTVSGTTEVKNEYKVLPTKMRVEAYPNPFNPTTKFVLHSSTSGYGSLVVYNVLGQVVQQVFAGELRAGSVQEIPFDGSSFHSGVYIAVFEMGRMKATQRVLLLK